MNEDKSRERLRKMTLVFVFLLPFDILPFAFGRSVATPAAVIVGALWLRHVLQHGARVAVGGGVAALVYLWWAWCVATSAWSVSLGLTALAVASLLAQLISMLALIEVLPEMREQSLRWFSAGASIVGVWALLTPVAPDGQGRVRVGGVDQNVTSLVLTVGVASAAYLIVFAQERISLLIVGAQFLVLLAAAIKVASRTGLVAIVGVLTVCIALSAWRLVRGGSSRFLRGSLVLGSGAALYGAMVASGRVPSRIVQFLQSPLAAYDSDRSVIIDAYLRFQGEWWLHGVGYGADAQFLAARGAGYQNAHSLFWKTWIETGLIGVVLLGLLILTAAARALRSRPPEWGALLLATPVAAFAVTLGGDRVSIFWYVIALGLSSRPPNPLTIHSTRQVSSNVRNRRTREHRGRKPA